jgi:hypothetical protein
LFDFYRGVFRVSLPANVYRLRAVSLEGTATSTANGIDRKPIYAIHERRREFQGVALRPLLLKRVLGNLAADERLSPGWDRRMVGVDGAGDDGWSLHFGE